ncbi:hypothetical protein MIMGU_mgv1a0011332mg, partial [Erythranthe guttata]
GDTSKAFDLFDIMISVGIQPSLETLASIFNGLKRTSRFQESHALLHEMAKDGFAPTERQYSSLITSMCKIGDIKGALKVKDSMAALSGVGSRQVAESALVRGLVQQGKTEEGVLVINRMLRGGIVPTVPTFTTVIHVLCKESKFSEALDCKKLMENHGCKPDVVTYNVLLTGLCRSGDIARAFALYEEMKLRSVCPNITTFYVLVSAVLSENDCVNGEGILKDLEERGLAESKDSTYGRSS